MEESKRKKRHSSRKKKIQLDRSPTSHSKRPSSSTSSSRDNPHGLASSSTAGSLEPSNSKKYSTSATSMPLLPTNIANNNAARSGDVPGMYNSRPSPAGDNSSATSPARSGTSSPEPNCAICLGKLENKSFTDSCFHMFCFVCLMEWSKVKAECPLCKQTFKSIVHNVRSYEDYDQYHIPQPEDRHHSNSLESLFLPSGVRFRYRTTVTDHRYAHLVNNINNEIESRLLQRPSSHLPIPNWRRIRQPANSEFRRNVYMQRLKLRTDQVNTRRRVREASPSFYRENPAQTHRLVPWLNRELNALLHSHGSQVAFVLEMIVGLIKRYAIDSEEFYQHLYPYTGRNTRRFMQEFLAFAKSPYHMAAYDRHVTYEHSNEPNIDSGSESDHQADDGNDSDVVVVSPPPPRSPSPVRPGPSSLTHGYLSSINWMYNPYTPMVRSSGQDDLSTAATGHRSDLFGPTSASGWDSPTVNPTSSPPISPPYSPVARTRSPLVRSPMYRPTSPLGRSSRDHGTSYSRTQPVDRTSRDSNTLFNPSVWDSFLRPFFSSTSAFLAGGSFGMTNPSSRSSSEPTVSGFGRLGSPAQIQSIAEGPSTSQADTLSDSGDSDVEIIEVEKPWTERSPIQLSSGEESDFDVIITGTGHVDDEVKKEADKKKKKKHKRHESGHDSSRRKRHGSSTSSRDGHSKKRKHSREKSGKSRSPSRTQSNSPSEYLGRSRPNLPISIRLGSPYSHRSRSRSRSKSPLRIRIQTSGYQHKKFAYKGNEQDHSLYHKDHRSSSQLKHSDNNHDSDSSFYSITSSKRRLKSGRSSIEIVEYRKTSSKHKKNKKHKDKSSEKHKQHKRDREHYQSSEGSSTHKHKAKRKKEHKEKSRHKQKHKTPDKGSHSAEKSNFRDQSSKLPNSDTVSFTSDSESDSNSEMEATEPLGTRPVKVSVCSQREAVQSKMPENENILGRSGPKMTFEEINASQAAIIDEELETINNALKTSDYISSLFDQNKKAQEKSEQQAITLNTDPNKLVNPNAVFNLKRFKKHPYGHKKTCKSNEGQSSRPSTIPLTVHELLSESSHTDSETETKDDNIQSSDITSCSDLVDSEKQLPSFSSFSKRTDGRINRLVADDSKHETSSSPARKIPSSSTSQLMDSGKERECEQGQFPLVNDGGRRREQSKTLHEQWNLEESENSDVDIIGITSKKSPDIPKYFTSSTSLPVHVEEPVLDVTRRKSPDIPEYLTSSTSLPVRFEEPFMDVEAGVDGLDKITHETSRKDRHDRKLLVNNGHRLKSFSKSAEFFTENNKFHKVHDEEFGELSEQFVDIEGDDSAISDDEIEISKIESKSSGPEFGDVSEQDSEVECSLVEGHKTFEILDESDTEEEANNDEQNDPDIDVLRYSEDEVTLDVETVDEAPPKTDVENEKCTSEVENDSSLEDLDVETAEEPNSQVSRQFESPYQLDSFDLLRNAPRGTPSQNCEPSNSELNEHDKESSDRTNVNARPQFDSPYQLDSFDLLRNTPSGPPQNCEPRNSNLNENENSERDISYLSPRFARPQQQDSFELLRKAPSDPPSQKCEPSHSEFDEKDKTEEPNSQTSTQFESPYELDSFDLLRNAPRCTPSQICEPIDSGLNENNEEQSERGNSYASPHFDSPYTLDSFDLLRNAPRGPPSRNGEPSKHELDEKDKTERPNSQASTQFESPYKLDSFDILRNALRGTPSRDGEPSNSELDEKENSYQIYTDASTLFDSL